MEGSMMDILKMECNMVKEGIKIRMDNGYKVTGTKVKK